MFTARFLVAIRISLCAWNFGYAISNVTTPECQYLPRAVTYCCIMTYTPVRLFKTALLIFKCDTISRAVHCKETSMPLRRRHLVKSLSFLPFAWSAFLFGEPSRAPHIEPTTFQSGLEPGDWVEGTPKWWWKYVFPTPDTLWRAVSQAAVFGPSPDPWRQQIGAVLQAAVMIQTSGAVKDRAVAAKLRNEAINNINGAVKELESRKPSR